MSGFGAVAVPFVARICLVALFPFSALDKIVYWKDALKQAQSSFLPCGPGLVVLAIAIEVITPICIVIGWHDRLAAFVLAGFCAVTAFLYHPFWTFADFWTPGDSKGRRNFWDFLKNFGLVGGLLLLIVVADFAPASAVIEHPLASRPRAASVTAAPAATGTQSRLPTKDAP